MPFSASPRTVPYPLFRCLIRCLCLNTVPTPNGEAQLLVGDRHPNRANWRNRSPGPPILTLELRLANHAAATPGALRRRQRSCPGHASAWLPSTRRLRARTAARRCSEHSSRTRSTVTVKHQICSERALRVNRCRWRVAHASSASVPSARRLRSELGEALAAADSSHWVTPPCSLTPSPPRSCIDDRRDAFCRRAFVGSDRHLPTVCVGRAACRVLV